MGLRRMGSSQRKRRVAKTRQRNGKRKSRARASRERGMVRAIEGRMLPYESWVMNWLSVTLGKPTRQITQDDVSQAVAQTSARAAS